MVIWRRYENNWQLGVGWERVLIDRTSGITSENVIKNADGSTYPFDRSCMKSDGTSTVFNQYIFDSEGNKSGKVSMFKKHIERMIKTIKFDELYGSAFVAQAATEASEEPVAVAAEPTEAAEE